jgi:hypothetical protein
MSAATTNIIPRSYNNVTVQQRTSDDYFNATAMCKAAGKPWANYWRNETAQAFVNQLSTDIQIRISELIQGVKGGDPELQGTWVHPQVAMHLAQWLSPKFAVAVSGWVFEKVSGRAPAIDSLPASALLRLATEKAAQNEERLARAESERRLLIEDFTKTNDRNASRERIMTDMKVKFKAHVNQGYLFVKQFEEAIANIGMQGDLMSTPGTPKPIGLTKRKGLSYDDAEDQFDL